MAYEVGYIADGAGELDPDAQERKREARERNEHYGGLFYSLLCESDERGSELYERLLDAIVERDRAGREI